MTDQFNIGIIGCGGIANRHASVLSRLEVVNLVAFCDIAEDRAIGFNEKYAESKAKIYTDFAQMYDSEELDVVWICLPPFAHTNEVELAEPMVTAAHVQEVVEEEEEVEELEGEAVEGEEDEAPADGEAPAEGAASEDGGKGDGES